MMCQLSDIIKELRLKVFYFDESQDRRLTGVYCGDLLSDVLANAETATFGSPWQMHPNITGVASLKELSGIFACQ